MPFPRPSIVAICGSTRFIAEIAICAWEFEKRGTIALAPMLLPSGFAEGSHKAEADGVKDKIDELFLRKIELADSVFVYNKGGYIGDSTRAEIAHAIKCGKSVIFLEPLTGDQSAAVAGESHDH